MISTVISKILTPSTKCGIRRILHFLYRVKSGEKKIQSSYKINRISDSKADVFFGYYDITPFDKTDKKLLYIKRYNDKSVDIILRDIFTETETVLTTSNAWNWQQGCRLRWIDDNIISFNDYRKGEYINRILDLNTSNLKNISWPLYDISPDKSLGLSLNFERLGFLRPGYGYRCQNIKPSDFDDTGISIIDIASNTVIKEIPLSEIHKITDSKQPIASCYINHLAFGPTSNKFLFFWIEIINGYHKASLIVYDILTQQYHILENEMKVSHYVWESDNSIICSAYKAPSLCNYYRYSLENNSKEVISPQILNQDGHPSFFTEREIITDTYPDKNGFQKLFIVGISNTQVKGLLRIYSNPQNTGEKRTDLHPRLNHKKNSICIDSRINKRREIIILELK